MSERDSPSNHPSFRARAGAGARGGEPDFRGEPPIPRTQQKAGEQTPEVNFGGDPRDAERIPTAEFEAPIIPESAIPTPVPLPVAPRPGLGSAYSDSDWFHERAKTEEVPGIDHIFEDTSGALASGPSSPGTAADASPTPGKMRALDDSDAGYNQSIPTAADRPRYRVRPPSAISQAPAVDALEGKSVKRQPSVWTAAGDHETTGGLNAASGRLPLKGGATVGGRAEDALQTPSAPPIPPSSERAPIIVSGEGDTGWSSTTSTWSDLKSSPPLPPEGADDDLRDKVNVVSKAERLLRQLRSRRVDEDLESNSESVSIPAVGEPPRGGKATSAAPADPDLTRPLPPRPATGRIVALGKPISGGEAAGPAASPARAMTSSPSSSGRLMSIRVATGPGEKPSVGKAPKVPVAPAPAQARHAVILPPSGRVLHEVLIEQLSAFRNCDVTTARRAIRRGKGILARDLEQAQARVLQVALQAAGQPVLVVRQIADLDFAPAERLDALKPEPGAMLALTATSRTRITAEMLRMLGAGIVGRVGNEGAGALVLRLHLFGIRPDHHWSLEEHLPAEDVAPQHPRVQSFIRRLHTLQDMAPAVFRTPIFDLLASECLDSRHYFVDDENLNNYHQWMLWATFATGATRG